MGDQYKDYNTEMSSFWGVAYGFVDGDKEKLQKDVAVPAIKKYFSILEKQAKARTYIFIRSNLLFRA